MKEEKKQKGLIEIGINEENGIKTFFEIDPYIFDKEYKNNDYFGIEARLSGFPSEEKNMMKEDGKINLFNVRLIVFFSFKMVPYSKIFLFNINCSYTSYSTNKKQKLILFNSQK